MNPNPETPEPAPAAAPTPIRLSRIGLIVIVLVVIGLLIGFVPRWISHRLLATEAHADAVPTVDVVSPTVGKADLGTPLPAEVEAFVSAAIHARASGYLKNWFADIGQAVTNGQLLAEIESPEVDEQLAQARAQLAQAQAACALAKTTADRWTELLKTASVSEQETAEKTGDYAVQQANVQAAQANVQRLEALKSYDSVTAPFAGTITARNTDIGQLIAADSGPELFDLAQTDPLRVYVRVPQPLIHVIAPGQEADLMFQESPGKIFPATVTRTAGAVDPSSRTLQVELQVPNPKGEILAGSYAQVRFHDTPAAKGTLVLSDNCLIFRAQGMQVAVVGSDNKVTLRSVRLGRDFGNTIEVLDGVTTNDQVIVNPPDSIADGMAVQISVPVKNTSEK
jgi:membrane fusion protein (multidrug efflux system)